MNTPLRIGYVVRMFPRFSETFVVQEILELERQNVEVVIFSLLKPDEGRFHPALTRIKAQIIYLEDMAPRRWTSWIAREWEYLAPHAGRLWGLVNELVPADDPQMIDLAFTSAALASHALRSGIDAFHAHFATVSCTAAFYASRITGIPFSFTAHAKDIFSDNVDRNLLTAKINASCFTVTVSNYNREFLAALLPDAAADRIRVLYNGVDLDYFSYRPLLSEQTPPVILSVGRLVAKKGFADLVTACGYLRDRGHSFRCLIVGHGREEVRLREQIASLGLGSVVVLCGALNQDEVRQLMQDAAVFCLPCIRDTDGNQDALPTVLLESMACGLPVVSTRLSGIPEIVDDGVNGILVGAGDALALTGALERLLTSTDLRRSYAEAGRRKTTERFSLQRNVSILRQWFEEAHTNRVGGQDKMGSLAPASQTKVLSHT